jgi:hypothetical protein
MCVDSSRLKKMCVADIIIYIQFAIRNYFKDTRLGLSLPVLYHISREFSNVSFSTAAVMAYSLAGVCTILKRCASTQALGNVFRVSPRNFCNRRNTIANGWRRAGWCSAYVRAVVPYWMSREPRVKGMSQYSTCVHSTTDQSELSPAVMCNLSTRNKAILVVIICTTNKCVRESHDDANREN